MEKALIMYLHIPGLGAVYLDSSECHHFSNFLGGDRSWHRGVLRLCIGLVLLPTFKCFSVSHGVPASAWMQDFSFGSYEFQHFNDFLGGEKARTGTRRTSRAAC
jgi:hypothetical protein